MGSPISAAIDCGTNSVRLIIGDESDVVVRDMRITRLGRGVDATGELAPAAIDGTLAVLREYRELCDHHGVSHLRVTATSAARDARNREAFFLPAFEILGVEPELLSGEEEAELSFLGATAELDPALGPFLVVDIGGGSTEFSFGTERFQRGVSIDVGCVRMTERFLLHDPPLPEELSNCLGVLDQHLEDVVRAIPEIAEVKTLVGVAGTFVTVAAVELGLVAYERSATHHFELTKAAAEDVFRTLASESIADRVHNPGLSADRADVIVGGCCILVAVLRHLGVASCLVSESDILDGLLASVVSGASTP